MKHCVSSPWGLGQAPFQSVFTLSKWYSGGLWASIGAWVVLCYYWCFFPFCALSVYCCNCRLWAHIKFSHTGIICSDASMWLFRYRYGYLSQNKSVHFYTHLLTKYRYHCRYCDTSSISVDMMLMKYRRYRQWYRYFVSMDPVHFYSAINVIRSTPMSAFCLLVLFRSYFSMGSH